MAGKWLEGFGLWVREFCWLGGEWFRPGGLDEARGARGIRVENVVGEVGLTRTR